MTILGSVGELHRYPVKSMLGEALASAEVATRGIVGDRVHALIDVATGKVASAKLPHRWRALLGYAASYGEGGVSITAPDGDCFAATGSDARMSAALGRAVTMAAARPADLAIDRADPDAVAAAGVGADVAHIVRPLGAAAPEGGFFDFAPIHVITRGSVAAIAAVADDVSVGRFRPNIVIDAPDLAAFAENAWAGGILAIGATLRLEILIPTPRCAVPTLTFGSGVASPKLTTIIGQHNRVPVPGMGALACLGAYARVAQAGVIAPGDAVSWQAPPIAATATQ
ncbi:hypothetical protein IP88_16455 [alpha proteobacterium AAP81b]|nr:hypothetical protein IP88_16455 [alpha proteobacterium AAP81b]